MILRNEYLAMKRKVYLICCGTYIVIAPFVIMYTNLSALQTASFSLGAVLCLCFYVIAWKWPKKMFVFEVTMAVVATLCSMAVLFYGLIYSPQSLFKVKHWSLIAYLFYFFALGSKAGMAVSLINLVSAPVIIITYTLVSNTSLQAQFIEWQLASTIMVIMGYNITLLSEQHISAIQDIAHTDSLTHLPNRRRLEEALQAEYLRAERYHRPFSVVLFDIDLFKNVNDRFGHRTGDDVLCGISAIAANKVRSTDLLGRWGGEEFLLICPETGIAEAYDIAERIRSALEVHSFLRIGTITCSFGITAYQAGDTVQQLLDRVDAALYKAKDHGRNRSEVMPL